MATYFKLGSTYSFILSIAAFSVCFSANQVFAQVKPDGTLGAESSVVNPNLIIKGLPSDRIDGGGEAWSKLVSQFSGFLM